MFGREGATQRRSSAAKRRATLTAVIAEESETVIKDEEARDGSDAAVKTPMVTALLEPRMLEQRAAYSRLTTRRDRLSFLRQRTAVPGVEAQVHGERLYVDEQPQLRRLLLRPEPRPAAVMGIRASDRRADDVAALTAALPPGTVLLQPPADDDNQSLSTLEEDDNEDFSQLSRTLDNWAGLTGSPT